MAKVIYKMLPWPTNTFGPRRKSIIWVKIDPWPRFGHIFVHITFSKLPKITWKWRILIDSQAGSISYQKALAKGQREMKNQSFYLWTWIEYAWISSYFLILDDFVGSRSGQILAGKLFHALLRQVLAKMTFVGQKPWFFISRWPLANAFW